MNAPLRILMLEDNPAHAELAKHALTASGLKFDAQRVETRRDFEQELAAHTPDLVLSDYSLPAFEGIDALRIAQCLAPDIPFIFVTGTLGEDVAIETLKIGATDYVLKKHLARLGPSVRRALRETAERRERCAAEKKLQQSNEQLRALTAYLQHVREEERIRISRQVHDELGQALTGLKLDVASLISRLPKHSRGLRGRAHALSDCIDATIQTVRRISTELRPGILDNLGLAAAIEWQAQEFQQKTGIVCATTTTVADTLWNQRFTTAFFRIFQEILTNIIRHASASRVEVFLGVENERLVLRVTDDGRGISEAEVAGDKSIGLIGIRERAALLLGEVAFAGRPGLGTTVTVGIPLASAEPLPGRTP
jgi:signal transduction histidine kinase